MIDVPKKIILFKIASGLAFYANPDVVELRKPRDSRVVPYSFSDEQKILVC